MTRFHTPLRYPGGKQKLTPFVEEVIIANNLTGGGYAEPYAGGAGVAIELLLSGRVTEIHLNDASPAIFAFWDAVLYETEELCRRIRGATLTVEEWKRQREILKHHAEYEGVDLGFSLFYLNRCNRSGIPLGGLIGGQQQNGTWKMDARFNQKELVRRVQVIASKVDSITLHNLDAERYILDVLPELPQTTLVYCDPPYFQRSRRLYLNNYQPADHARIAGVIQNQLHKPWLVSYDNAPEILGYYEGREPFTYSLQYSAATRYEGSEVFFFSDNLELPETSRVPAIHRVLQGPGLFD